ncbi:MAG: midcut-by-XrtH protein [Azoarcus sp.]|nr:midcut-by-XrtH protein [Azoarcus sp.]
MALILPGLSLAIASGSAWSQSVTYGPFATAIPSLGGVALVLLSAMMFFALWQMKKRGLIDGSRFMALALVSGALASGVSGVKLVADVSAQGGAASVSLDNPAGDTEPLFFGPNCVRNVTSVVQEIRDIDYGVLLSNAGGDENLDCYEVPIQGGGLADDCAVGTRLQPTLACFVWAGFPPLQGGNNGGI